MKAYRPLTRKQLWTIWLSLNEMRHIVCNLDSHTTKGIENRAGKAMNLIQSRRKFMNDKSLNKR